MFFPNPLTLVLKLLEAILSVSLTITVVLPSFSLLWIVNTIYRAVIYATLRIRSMLTAEIIQLSSTGLDNIWGYQTKGRGNSRNVLFVTVYSGPVDGAKYKANFLSNVINYTSSKGSSPYQKLTKIFTRSCGYYCWKEDPNFSIDNHVVVYPDDRVYTEADVFEMLSELSKDMSEEHPQWQELILPRFRAGAGSGSSSCSSLRILRFHHSYGDAGSWLLLYSYTMADGKIPYAINPLEGFRIPKWKLFLYYLNVAVFGTSTILRALAHGREMKDSSRLVTKYYNGDKVFDWSESVELGLLKGIKARTGTSIGTVLASVIGGGLRRLDEKYPRKCSKVGDVTSVGFVGAILPYPSLTLTNRFTIANLRIPTSHMSRVDRLLATHRIGMALASSPGPIINYWMFSYFGMFPVWVQDLFMTNAGTAVVFSNLPGASKAFHLHGDEVEIGAAWVPLLTCAGLSISACGYKNGLRLCASSDTAALSKNELKFVLSAIVDEIRQLANDTVGLV